MISDSTTDVPGVVSSDLFDLDSVLLDSPRLKEIKKHDIQTHHAPHVTDAPWLAIPMHAAREIVGALPYDPACDTLPEIMAHYCRLLDEADILFYGMTEREAQDRALDHLSNTKEVAGEALPPSVCSAPRISD